MIRRESLEDIIGILLVNYKDNALTKNETVKLILNHFPERENTCFTTTSSVPQTSYSTTSTQEVDYGN